VFFHDRCAIGLVYTCNKTAKLSLKKNKKIVPPLLYDGYLPFISLTNIFMKASRYLRVSLAKSHCEWCMGGRCITTTGKGKETIKNSIMSGVDTYNNWVECPDNASE
jgi:hypothetical protein